MPDQESRRKSHRCQDFGSFLPWWLFASRVVFGSVAFELSELRGHECVENLGLCGQCLQQLADSAPGGSECLHFEPDRELRIQRYDLAASIDVPAQALLV